MKRLVLTLLALLLSFPIATAQPLPRRPGPGANPTAIRERIKKRIRDLRAYTLINELSLDPQIQTRLWPVLDKYDDETDKLVGQRVDIRRRLTAANTMGPREVERAIDDAIALQRSFRDLEDHRLAELRKILTPKQIAKLIIVLPEFERRIQNQLQRAITNATGRNPPGDVDDDLEPDERPPPTRKPNKQPVDPYNRQ
jgi:Spy/CpxP family protein refolding chaperone